MEYPSGIVDNCSANLSGLSSQLFLTLINTLVASQCALSPDNFYPRDYGQYLNDGFEFDFIVVGAGSAGSVVASRLSDNKNWNVLLLEAGGYPSATSDIPAVALSMQGSQEDWAYSMEPSKSYCVGTKTKRCTCPRGKGLGGSSTINAMLYVRGNRKDFDAWAESGNPGWDYDTVLKYYKKFEDVQDDNHAHFGKGGDLPITQANLNHSIRTDLINAYEELGYHECDQERFLGHMDAHLTIKDGRRFNTAKAFLRKIKDRRNLYVALNAYVTRLLLDWRTKSARGVELQINNERIRIIAKNEVILSAGSISSPTILMNSGIGPHDHLKSLGINVLKNLSVGENLQDHLIYPAIYASISNENLKPRSNQEAIDDLYRYFMNRDGPLAGLGLLPLMAFINPDRYAQYPSLQIGHLLYNQNEHYILSEMQRTWNFPDELVAAQSESNRNSCGFTIFPILLNPKSRGRILLRSSDPFDRPIIKPNFLSDETDEDLNLLVKAVKFLEKLIETSAFAKYKPKIVDFSTPNCNGLRKNEDDHLRCLVRNLATTLYHPVGTCKMGPKSDLSAVVDHRMRVHGINGLRVIDASIMPTITSGNTNAPAIMIGERGRN